jgi:IMP dehydrogenase
MKFSSEYGDVALTFDDVLLAPSYSEVLPAEVSLRSRLVGDIYLNIPVVSAAMDTVTEAPMAVSLAKLGGIGVIHRNLTPEAQADEVHKVKQAGFSPQDYPDSVTDEQGRLLCAAAIGVGEKALSRLDQLVEAGVDVATIDTAHGHTRLVLETIRRSRKRHPKLPLLAGNVAGAAGARDLIDAGAGAIKVGIGAGSICTTRIVAGSGVPQLSAIAVCAAECRARDVPLIADGGIKFSGDIVKALAAGADLVMLGSLLAGMEESPGAIIEVGGKRFKDYRGMGSEGAMSGLAADRYSGGIAKSGGHATNGNRDKLVPEGVEGRVPYKGLLRDALFQLMGGLRAGMGYSGAADLGELREKARFVRITGAGLQESHPHGVFITREAPNYRQTR